jgi:formamidopyrimidine-DNA glycosylase
MEGKYRFRKNTAANQNINLEHILLKMYLSSQEILYFEDTRRFGKFYLQAKIEYENLTPYKDIGLEPFSLLLTPEYLLNH